MNSTYFFFLGAGALLWTGLFAWRLRRNACSARCALITLPLGAVLGFACSKLCYFLLEIEDQLVRYGLAGLFTDRPAEFSFWGGCLGIILAALIAARFTGIRPSTALDAFAPCLALAVSVARMAEGLLDPMCMIGVGDYVENEAHLFFPLAVENADLYSWFYAVFMLEAFLALLCAAGGMFFTRKRNPAPGKTFALTLSFLTLPQVLCERLLSQCMRWGFVRIEQLLCVVTAFGVVLYACVRLQSGLRAYAPACLFLLCVAVLIDMEFTLDNKPFFGLELSPSVCFGVIITMLLCMAALTLYAFRKLRKAEI